MKESGLSSLPTEVIQLNEESLKYEVGAKDLTWFATLSPRFISRLSGMRSSTYRLPFPKLRGMLEVRFRWLPIEGAEKAGW